MPKIKFTIITLFPEALQPYLDSSMLYKAQARDIISIDYVNLRDFGLGPHRSVDDTPYGGGDGMLLRCEPVFAAIESILAQDSSAKVILPTPVGQTWNQSLARRFADLDRELPADFPRLSEKSPENLKDLENIAEIAEKTSENPQKTANFLENPSEIDQNPAESSEKSTEIAQNLEKTAENSLENSEKSANPLKNTPETALNADFSISNFDPPCDQGSALDSQKTPENAPIRHFIILCPHYEGYDERIMTLVNYPISLGNYVLTGGELPALVIIDSISRLLPGVLGGETSAAIESFSDGDNLEYPQYTKPADFRGLKVPDVLLSGNHGKIAKWRSVHSKPASNPENKA